MEQSPPSHQPAVETFSSNFAAHKPSHGASLTAPRHRLRRTAAIIALCGASHAGDLSSSITGAEPQEHKPRPPGTNRFSAATGTLHTNNTAAIINCLRGVCRFNAGAAAEPRGDIPASGRNSPSTSNRKYLRPDAGPGVLPGDGTNRGWRSDPCPASAGNQTIKTCFPSVARKQWLTFL